MIAVAILLVMLVSFGFIASPFFVGRRWSEEGPRPGQPWDDLVSQRDTAYEALKELEFEYRLGNLSDADYADLSERYANQAADILQRLDIATESAPAAQADSEIRSSPGKCASCQEAVEVGDTYCWRCGDELSRRCGICGERVLEDDRFCAGCGQQLGAEVMSEAAPDTRAGQTSRPSFPEKHDG